MDILKIKDDQGNWHNIPAIIGPGIATGGTTGQVLKKKSGTDYDTEWETPVFLPGTGTDSAMLVTPSDPNTASGKYAVAIGGNSEASGNVSFAAGSYSVASGVGAVAAGAKTDAETYGNRAIGAAAVSLGGSNTASGNYAVALGYHTNASGNASVAVGSTSSTTGDFSAAIGNHVEATGSASFVTGQWNAPDENAVDSSHGAGARKYLMIVGNGTDTNNKSNALTVDWDGNEVIAGKMTVGAAPVNNMDVATKQYVDSAIPSVPSAATNNPADLGAAAKGSSSKYAREDHVHKMPSAADVGAVPSGQGVPSGGTTGQILKKRSETDYDTEWSDFPEAPVSSVNTKTGAVVLDAEDVGAATPEDVYDTYSVKSGSGSIVTISDGADGIPVKSLIVNIDPVQSGSGDPAPDNVRPISGWTQAKVTRTGKNLFDNAHAPYYGRYISYTSPTSAEWRTSGDSASYCIPVKPNTKYAIKPHATTTIFRACAISTDPATMGSAAVHSVNAYSQNASGNFYCTITTGPNERWLVIQCGKSVTEGRTGMVMVELGNGYSEYEDYQGASVTIDLDGTVYGGTLDVLTGVLTVDRALVTNDGSNSGSYGYGTFPYISLPGGAIYKDGAPTEAITNLAVPSGIVNGYILRFDNGISGVTDKTSFGTLLAQTPMQIVAPLATPQTVQLDSETLSTLLGANNIWADTGDVTVEYCADPTLRLDEVENDITSVEAMLTGVEVGMTATKNYSSGNLLVASKKLYRATQSIANGASIVPGTNVIQTTIEAEINALTASKVGAVASNQGSTNAGKFLVVGNDGVVVPVTMQTWQASSY